MPRYSDKMILKARSSLEEKLMDARNAMRARGQFNDFHGVPSRFVSQRKNVKLHILRAGKHD